MTGPASQPRSVAAPGSPTLEAIRGELRAAGHAARELASGLGEAALWWRPAPDRWSIGECLDHLVLTGEAYLPVLDETIEDGRRRGRTAPGPYRRTLVGRWLPRLLEPPPGLRIAAPREIRPPGPSPDGPRPNPLPAFLELRGRLEERLDAAAGLDLGRLGMASPFYGWIRFDLGSAFRILAAHERRHLWQARQVLEADGFPAA